MSFWCWLSAPGAAGDIPLGLGLGPLRRGRYLITRLAIGGTLTLHRPGGHGWTILGSSGDGRRGKAPRTASSPAQRHVRRQLVNGDTLEGPGRRATWRPGHCLGRGRECKAVAKERLVLLSKRGGCHDAGCRGHLDTGCRSVAGLWSLAISPGALYIMFLSPHAML